MVLTMLEHTIIGPVTVAQAREVARKDAPTVATDVDKYVTANQLSYYIVCNTWVLLWKDYAQHAWVRFLSTIMEDGLLKTIDICQEEAMRIIRRESLGPWARILTSEVRNYVPSKDRQYSDTLIGDDVEATVLFLLRYPKRFSPLENDKIRDKSIKDFLSYENRTKLLQRRCSMTRHMIVQYVRCVIRDMYDWDEICTKIDDVLSSPQGISFSPGTAVDSRPNTGDKMKAIIKSGRHEEYIMPIFGVYTLPRPAQNFDRERRIAKVLAVPKSYKASRIIAMDDTYRNAISLQIEEIFRNCDRNAKYPQIDLERQEINQEYAYEGSVFGNIATLDASHASDLQSKTLFIDVFPLEYTRRVASLLPDHYEVNGSVRMMQMASTSGHALTFRHETIVYKAIAAAAIRFLSGLCPDLVFQKTCMDPSGEEVGFSHAYGDDTEVATEAYDTVLFFFSTLGLIINQDKSYADGPYRESCGKEYMDGKDFTSVYYPRFPIVGSISTKGDHVNLDADRIYNDTYRGKIDNSLTMLIDLQKKLIPLCYDASRFVSSLVTTAYPSVTASPIGTICDDLWDYVEFSSPRKVPTVWHIEKTGDRAIPRDLNFSFKCDGKILDHLTGEDAKRFKRLLDMDGLHTYPVVQYKPLKGRKYTQFDVCLFEYYRYWSFLKTGPRYADDLDRLLGISQRPMTISEFFGEACLKLAKK
jgi:hypothetical protein